MSNFLTRLINRHLDSGDYVRPRLRTRFEPDAVNAKPPTDPYTKFTARRDDSDSQRENITHIESLSKPAINDGPGDTTDSGARDKSGKGSVYGSIEPRHRHRETENRDFEAGQLNDHRPKSTGLSGPERSIDSDRKGTQSHKRSKSVSPPRSVIRENERITDNDAQKNIDRSVRPATGKSTPQGKTGHQSKFAKSDLAQMCDSTTRQDGDDDRYRDQSRPELISLRNIMAESEGLLEPQFPIRIDGQSEAPARMSSRSSGAGTEPVINVTIGRIEIRAVQDREHKEAKGQAKPSGIMSLNQYLQQRARGGNR